MKYQVIARRYRPRRFDEVVGQESVGATLRNAILQERLAHAYLFTGPRGVGKTSMARIFARALNCPKARDRSRPESEWGVPCEECDLCRAVHSGDDIDVLEVDGASYRGIDEVREIIEGVKFMPSRSPFKVFIVDEVHMLTREAFNALLKTLEEPPAHVVFVFATTEPHRIPDTVLSRCQRFDFRPITEVDIVRRLAQICEGEGVTAEPGLLEKIARCGKGGMRDAQTLLDQVITFSDATLKSEDLERITGRLPETAIEAVVLAVEERNPGLAFEKLGECFRAGSDPAVLLEQLIELWRAKLEALLGPEAVLSAEGQARRGSPVDTATLDLLIGRLQVLQETAVKLRNATHPRLAVELAVVKLARLSDPRAIDEALRYLKGVEQGSFERGGVSAPAPSRRAALAAPAAVATAPLAAPPPVIETPSVVPSPPSAAPAARTVQSAACDFARLRSLWEQIIIENRSRAPSTAAFLARARLKEPRDGNRCMVALSAEFHLKQLREPRRLQAFEALVREVTGEPWVVALELDPQLASAPEDSGGNGNGNGDSGGGPRPPAASADPAPSNSAAASRFGSKPPELDDPLVKKSVELFRGRIV